MAVIGGIMYTDKPDYGMNEPYDGINIKPDRQGGWNVRSPMLEGWIEHVPDRAIADRVEQALLQVAETAASCQREISEKLLLKCQQEINDLKNRLEAAENDDRGTP